MFRKWLAMAMTAAMIFTNTGITALAAETVNPTESESIAESVAETEMVLEIESAFEAETVLETESAFEAETVLETESAFETETVLETESAVETEGAVETESVVETESAVETEVVLETETVLETGSVVETEAVLETEAAVETEIVLETESADETASALEKEALLAAAETAEFTYTENADGTVTITGYALEPSGDLNIPAEIDGKKVAAIGDNAFASCSGFMGTLTIPDGVTSIGEYAFKGCSGLSGTLTIPDSVTTIGSFAFNACKGFTGELIIPGSLKNIRMSTFTVCTGIEKLTISEGVLTIGSTAFLTNSSIAEVELPESLISIGDGAFRYCSALTSVSYGGSEDKWKQIVIGAENELLTGAEITYGEDDAESEAFALTYNENEDGTLTITGYIGVPSGNLEIPAEIDGKSVSAIGNEAFENCTGFTGTLTIPKGIISIGEWAFGGCSGFIGSLNFPESITDIGNGAFSYCTGFTGSLTIPGSVVSIRNSVFFGCSGLDGILTIEEGTTETGNYVFNGCSGLESAYLPKTLKSIGASVFTGMTALADVYYAGTESEWAAVTIGESNDSLDSASLHFSEETESSPEPATNLSWSDSKAGTAVFNNPNEDASNFEVTLYKDGEYVGMQVFSNSEAEVTADFGYDISESGTYTYQVSVYAGDLFMDMGTGTLSEVSSEFVYTRPEEQLSIPQNITWNEAGEISWDAVENAAGYEVGLYKADESAESGYTCAGTSRTVFTSCYFSGAMEEEGEYYAVVRSLSGDISVYAHGDASEYVLFDIVIYESESGFTYAEKEDGTIIITGYSLEPEGDLNIPAKIDGKKVSEIGARAFWNMTGFTGALTIPAGITGIGDYAFSGCNELTGELVIPKGVTSIGNRAFTNCVKFSGDLVIPDGVISIGDYAFYGCTGLTGSLTIPDSVTSIGNYAFGGYSRFTGSLTIPEKLTSIGTSVFWNESGFTGELKIPAGVTSIGNTAFWSCSGFTGNIAFPEGLTYIGKAAFYGCTGITSIELPKTIETIDLSAFSEMTALTDVYYAGSESDWKAVTIGDSNDSLTNAEIHFAVSNFEYEENKDGTLTITGYAADPAYDLVIPAQINGKKVTAIGDYAFENCTGFDGTLTIPDGIISIGKFAFSGCSNLSGDLKIPDSVTTIGQAAFNGCSGFDGTLTLSENVTVLTECVFQNCSGFTGTLEIPYGVTRIGSYTFTNCSGFTGNLVIPDSVTTLGGNAFSYCTGFDGTLTISENLTMIGVQAFWYCGGFTGDLEIPGSVEIIYPTAFSECRGFDGTLTINEGVTTIMASAFLNCLNISCVYLPKSVTTIGSSSFRYMFDLTDVYYAGTKSDWRSVTNEANNDSLASAVIHYAEESDIVGQDHPEFTYIVNSDDTLTITGYTLEPAGDLIIPGQIDGKTVTAIGKYAFWGNSGFDGELVIPDSVKKISEYAFDGCSGLSGSLSLPAEMSDIGAYAFSNCSGFTGDLNIPNGITEIKKGTFNECTGFDGELTLPTGLNSIREYAFWNCMNLTGDLIIPLGVTVIEPRTFFGCVGFNGKLEIPEGVETIGAAAFADWSMTELYLPETVASIEGIAFGRISTLEHIYFAGSRSEWNEITIAYNNDALYDAELHFLDVVEEEEVPFAFTYTENADGTLTLTGYQGTPTGILTIPEEIDGKAVTVIGTNAFEGCSNFADCIVIPEGIVSIGAESFKGCEGVTSIKISSSVSEIDFTAFEESEISTIIYMGSEEKWEQIQISGIEREEIAYTYLLDFRGQSGFWIDEIADHTYTGTAIKPAVRVYDGDVLMTEGTDYKVSYKNTKNVNDASDEKTAPTVVVTGKGNYSGSKTATFRIVPGNIEEDCVTAEDITVKYTGKVQKPVPTVLFGGKKLSNKKDFTVSYPDLEENAYKEIGEYTIRITGIGGYTGTKDIKLVVADAVLMSKATVSKITAQTYTGDKVKPDVVVKYGKTVLQRGADYTVSYEDNVEIGNARIILTGQGDYAGTKEVTFKITGTPIKSAKVTGLKSSVEYTGNEIKQTCTLQMTVNGEIVELTEGEDYTAVWSKNQAAGKAKVTFTGINHYTGTLSKTFTISKYDISSNESEKFAVEENVEAVYVKGGSKPKPTVTFNGVVLEEGTDYKLSYKNNKAVNDGSNPAKMPTVVVTGKGNFKGSCTAYFTIVPQDLQSVSMAVPDKVYQNKKNAWKSAVTLTDSDGKKLKAGTDFEKELIYRYESDTKLADGTERYAGDVVEQNDIPMDGTVLRVTAEGKGNYQGEITAGYRITKYTVSKAKVKIPVQEYTGNEITLEKEQLTITVGGTALQPEDYEIIGYSNNVKKGTASVIIQGCGEYGGQITAKFKIAAKNLAQ